MDKTNQYETQGSVSEFAITLISGETINLLHTCSEYINEERDGCTNIDIKLATYNQRLYDAFKNKELVQYIVKKTPHRIITNLEEVDREFYYDSYFTIDEFSMEKDMDDCATYNIVFRSI